MASPSEEARSRLNDQARDARPAAEQASLDAALGHGEPDPFAGWTRKTSHEKDVPYARGPVSKR